MHGAAHRPTDVIIPAQGFSVSTLPNPSGGDPIYMYVTSPSRPGSSLEKAIFCILIVVPL